MNFLSGPAVWLYANCALLYTPPLNHLKLQQDLANLGKPFQITRQAKSN